MQSFMSNAGVWVAVMVLLSIGSLLLVAVVGSHLIRTLPRDYFMQVKRPRRSMIQSLIMNLVGAFLLLAGVVMLFVPGQGLLTMLLGLILMDFPGKYALERRLVERPGLLKTINHVRARSGSPPLESPRNQRRAEGRGESERTGDQDHDVD